jgi:PIN like domain
MKIFIDENLSPFLARGIHILEQHLDDNFEVLSIKDVFGKGVKDEEWIPQVGKMNGVVITQDKNIHRTKPQRELFERHGIGMFFISPPKNGYTYWQMVEILIKEWKDIKEKCFTKKPFSFIHRLRSGFKKW